MLRCEAKRSDGYHPRLLLGARRRVILWRRESNPYLCLVEAEGIEPPTFSV